MSHHLDYGCVVARRCLLLVIAVVRSLVGEQAQILYPIVGHVSVLVVDDFPARQKPSEMTLHYKAMLKHHPSPVTGWMLGAIFLHIALSVQGGMSILIPGRRGQ